MNHKNFKVLLLAAGYGTRLGELTKNRPKCLIPIGGIPILGIWIKKLEKF
ncbi:sugar phosphate nucleotidyltransferase [Prochlorococcus sp. AH-716-A09]|nr:sugar phosphate nucleotidyltransferase [Prochlorococcus sp. AH-716-A09]